MNKELKLKIKNLIEDLNYRTDQKSPEELKKLSAELHEAAIELVFLEKMPKIEAPAQENSKTKTIPAAEPKVPVVDLFAEMVTEPVAEIEPEHKIEPQTPEVKPEEQKVKTEKVEVGVNVEHETATIKGRKTLNDSFQSGITVGFNDRFAFVHKLFDGNEDEYYRVMSQLNSMGSFSEAVAFLDNVVKPDYNWKGSEEFELRLKEILEQHFN